MKKLLMTVLTLALILGCVSVASAASGKVRLTDIADNANEEAIQVTYDLGIVTGTPEGGYEPDKAVNRAEFAALIVRALAIPDSALASYTNSTFKDTDGYGWAAPYLAVLQQRGIMKGDGYGNAMPGRTITPNEAVTMVLRAVGYTDNASVLVGQWPANYVALGQNQNLYEDVANDTQMSKASAAQMIYNVLTVQLVQVDANSTVSYLWDRIEGGTQAERNLLTTGLNCWQDGKKIVDYGDASASKIDLVPKVGAYGILYRSRVDNEVVALTEVETVFLAGKFTYKADATAINGRALNKFKALDGKEYNLSTDAQATINGNRSITATTASSGSAIFINGDNSDPSVIWDYVSGTPGTPSHPTNSESSKLIIAAKVSGVTILELRSIAVWDAEYSGQGDHFLYESGQIDGKKFGGHDFPLNNDNEVDDYGYVLNGVNSLNDIAADNVVYIYKNRDKKIARIDVGAETQSGSITNINAGDNQRTIGGKVLDDSPYHDSSTWSGLETINNEGTALLDAYGRTYAFKLGEASKGNFAVWVADGRDSFGAGTEKLFDKTAAEVLYGLKSGYTPPTPPYASPGNQGILIEYKLSGGKLSDIDMGRAIPMGSNNSVNAAGTIITIQGETHLIDSSVLVYVADDVTAAAAAAGDFRGADFSIGSIKDLLDDDLDTGFQYYKDSTDGRIKALLVDSSDAGAQKLFVMINAITQGSDGANGTIDVVRGLNFANGANATATTWNYDNDGLLGSTLLNTTSRGRYETIVQFSIGEDGVLKNAKRLDTVNPTIGTTALPARYVADSFYGGSGGTFTIRYTTNSAVEGLATFEANTVLYEPDGPNWKAVRPTPGNFKAHSNSAGQLNGDYIFLKTDDEKAYDVIIKIGTYR